MTFKSMLAVASVCVLGLSLVETDALAGGKKGGDAGAAAELPKIEATGVAEFDPTFMKAKAIHDSLDQLEGNLKADNTALASTLGLPAETSLADALAELKNKAEGKLEVAIEDGKLPRVRPKDAITEDAQKGVDAVNKLVDDLGKTLDATTAMPAEVTALGAEAKGFPAQLGPDILSKNNLAVTDLPKVTKKVNGNIAAINKTPERIAKVGSQATSMLDQVKGAFAN